MSRQDNEAASKTGISGIENESDTSPPASDESARAGMAAALQRLESEVAQRKQSEARFRALFESSNDAIFLLEDGIFVDCNPAALRTLGGIEREQVIGKSPVDFSIIDPDDPDTPARLVQMQMVAALNGKPQLFEWRARRPDGSEFTLEINLTRVELASTNLVQAVSRDITDRKRTEQQLQEAASRYRSLLDNLPQIIWQKDRNGVYETCNSSYAGSFDITPEQVAGKTDYDLYPPELAEKYRQDDQRIIAGGQVENFDERWIKGDEERVVHTTKVPLHGPDGHIFGTLGIAEDITERIQMEQALREREELMSAIVAQAGDAIELVDLETFRFAEFNDAAFTLLGFTPEEYARLKVFDIQGEMGKEQIMDVGARIPKHGSAQFETKHRRKDGSLIDVQVTIRKIELRDHPYVVAIWRDVTEQKRNTAELERYRQHLEQLVEERTSELKAANQQLLDTHLAMDRAGIAIHWVDADTGRILYVNNHAARMLDYDTEEMLELSIPDIDPNFSPNDFKGIADPLFATGSTHFETQLRKKDGTLIPVDVIGHLRPAEEGQPCRFITFISDITERKEAEDELLAAKAAAEQASIAKSSFLANMSHEIRTPMNAIIGMSHLALQSDLDDKQRNYIEKTNQSAEGLLRILDDILDFSKIESGMLDMEVTDFRLEEVMENLANLLGLKADEKGLELMFDVKSDVPTALVGDPLRLGQILNNLGGNAVKFTETGGDILIGVAVEEESRQSVLLHFSVQDTGIGMSEEEIHRVFRPFSQADSSTTRRFGGSGLGLVISRKLTELMRGDIWVESRQGRGSTFHFTARLEKQPEQPAKLPPAADIEPIKVLVVDDNDTARELLSHMLAGFGFAVDSVDGGKTAIARLERADAETPYDLVLMDWKMPEMDGIATTRAIQVDPELSHPPTVIMITAYNREAAMQAVQGVDLAGFLTKPVTPSTLLEAIQRAMGREWCVASHTTRHQEHFQEAVERLRGARVLLVEDNAINRELALELLVSNGLSVELATNGAEALEALDKDAFDGVLMDCQMPVLDGYAATRGIRAQDRFKALPIIAMTANAMVGDREKVIAAGMNDHIAKPIRVAEMFGVMARWINPTERGAADRPSKGPRATQVVDALPRLPGIDTAAGLAVTQGNERLYRKLLLRFREQHRDFARELLAARAGADPEALAWLAHTLKGVAGNLGVQDVRAAAETLQVACETTGADIDAALADVERALRPVLKGLEVLDGPAGPDREVVSRAIDRTVVESSLQELHELVASSNVNTAAAADRLQSLLEGSEYADGLKKVRLAAEEYDFETALRAVEELAAALAVKAPTES